MKKKVSVIGTVGLPPIYGGFETLADNLSVRHEEKWKNSFELSIYCTAFSYPDKLKKIRSTNLRYIPVKANGFYSVLYDLISMADAAFRKDDVIIILGVSGCFFLPLIKLITKGKIIVNIDGLEWRREKWGRLAKAFLKISEKIAVKFSDVVICDNQAISDYVNQVYSTSAENIAYGGDHVNGFKFVSTMLGLPTIYYFTVCRIEPENNVHLVLEAFSKAPQVNIVIVGNWDASLYGSRLREAFQVFPNIYMLDPIYDIDHLQSLRKSAVGYVHGHSAGGTNPSLVEAMSSGLAVFAFDCDFNRYTTDNQCFYFADAEDLVAMILTADSSELKKCSQKMLKLANSRYRWDSIADKYFFLC